MIGLEVSVPIFLYPFSRPQTNDLLEIILNKWHEDLEAAGRATESLGLGDLKIEEAQYIVLGSFSVLPLG